MNHNLKSKLGGGLFFDFDDLNCVEFNVVKQSDGYFNLIMDVGFIDTENEDYPYEYGYTIPTTIFEKDLVEIGKKVQAYLDLKMFEQLIFIEESYCFNEDADVQFEFVWSDYLLESSTVLN